jgi:hypothetical protein
VGFLPGQIGAPDWVIWEFVFKEVKIIYRKGIRNSPSKMMVMAVIKAGLAFFLNFHHLTEIREFFDKPFCTDVLALISGLLYCFSLA